MTVSWRRSADVAGGGDDGAGAVDFAAAGLFSVSDLPHFEQNLAPARLVAPHDEQRTGRATPHASQNLLSSGVFEWQLGHSMSAPRADEPWDY
jgi:hypothetical protein